MSCQVSTNKPRIQAYVDSRLHEQFEQERSHWGISQSQALERMLAERYQSDIARDREVASDRDLMPLITSINKLRLQVSNLEDELEERLLNKLESRFSSSLLSELPSKLPVKKESLKDKWDREVEEKYRWDDGYLHIKQADGSVKLTSGSLGDVSKKYNTCKLFDPYTDSQYRVDIDRLIPAGNSDSESELVTDELPSESELVTDELLSESDSKLLDLNKGISQRSLAKRLNCSHAYIGKLQKLGGLDYYASQVDPDNLQWELKGRKYYPKIISSSQ